VGYKNEKKPVPGENQIGTDLISNMAMQVELILIPFPEW